MMASIEKSKIANEVSGFIRDNGLDRFYNGEIIDYGRHLEICFAIPGYTGAVRIFSPKFIQVFYKKGSYKKSLVFHDYANAVAYVLGAFVYEDHEAAAEIAKFHSRPSNVK